MPPSSRRKTALITGASAGIGRALALRFAQADYDLVLVARDRAALEAAAQAARNYPGVTVTIVPADLSRADAAAYVLGVTAEKSILVDVLVNNAGFGVHGSFATTDLGRELELMTLQLGSLLALTKLYLPAMIARREGLLINVASVYAFASAPRQSVYSACKSFIRTFSSALRKELEGTGVSVSVVYPGVTTTEFRTRAGMGEKRTKLAMTAEEVASVTFDGAMKKQLTIVPGFLNKIFVAVSRHLPEEWLASLVRGINRRRGLEPGH